MNIFVAGATGVMGRALVPQLIAKGHTVFAMTRNPARTQRLADIGARPVVCDVYDLDGLKQAMWAASPDVVVHQLTSLPDAIDPRRIGEQLAENDRIRVEGTRNLVRTAASSGVNRVVAQSIAFAYAPVGSEIKSEDDPLWTQAPPPFRRSVEAVSALEAQVTSTAEIEGIALRYGYFYGPGTAYADDGSIAELVRARRFPIAGGGTGVFSFIHIEDAAAATVAAIQQGGTGTYNVVDDRPLRARDWLPAYARAVGAPAPRRVPGFLAKLVAGTYGHYMMTRQRGASNVRAKRALGWSPAFATLQAGLT